jgi:shikimate kinase
VRWQKLRDKDALVRQVVLIGPVCVGKTTLMPLVAGRLDRPAVDLDEFAGAYYEEVGRSRARLNEIGAARGDLGAYRWWQEGHPHAVRRVLEDYPDAVVALGAGHTTYSNAKLFEQVRALLTLRHTILLLPSPDNETSVSILRERAVQRNGLDWVMNGVDILEQWVAGEQNRLLASAIVYTYDRSPDDVADAIVDALIRLPVD